MGDLMGRSQGTGSFSLQQAVVKKLLRKSCQLLWLHVTIYTLGYNCMCPLKFPFSYTPAIGVFPGGHFLTQYFIVFPYAIFVNLPRGESIGLPKWEAKHSSGSLKQEV